MSGKAKVKASGYRGEGMDEWADTKYDGVEIK